MKTLICYPPGRKAWRYAVPPDVENLVHGTFVNVRYLKSLIFYKPKINITGMNLVSMEKTLRSIYVIRAIDDETNLTFISSATYGSTNFRAFNIYYITLEEYLQKNCAIKICTNSYSYNAFRLVVFVLLLIECEDVTY